MPGSPEARSPFALLDEVDRAREVLVLTYTATLEFFERFALADARALGALVSVISDATMVHPDPVVVRRAGTQYLDARALCRSGAFHPKLLVIVGDGEARAAIGSGNLTMAGWHGNAELWTVLRADEDGGPTTLRQLSAFLRDLATSDVTLGPGADAALLRTADELDKLPAEDPGPSLLHSLHEPIIDQLDPGPVDDLRLYAPFHDSALAGVRALLRRLRPTDWTAYVQPDTDVDGQALADLADNDGGRVAWVARQAQRDDGAVFADERYWHGKLAQWRRGEMIRSLTGSPNLSAAALLRTVADGNCELALVSEEHSDLSPSEGEPPVGGVATLVRSAHDDAQPAALVLLSAMLRDGAVALELHAPLVSPGVVQRYDATADHWRTSGTLTAGSKTYDVDLAAAPIGRAVRIVRDDHAASNSVFVADPDRLRRRQEKAIGKVRATPAEVARLGLGERLLGDLEELRGHLLRVGATVSVPRRSPSDEDNERDAHATPAARPAPGLSLEDFLAACDPVLGHRMTEFALVLPALPGTGAALDDTLGTLDIDEDTDATAPETDQSEPTLGEELQRRSTSERDRYRRFLERLVSRVPDYPLVVRNLAAHSVLHAIAASLWADEDWPRVLAQALAALAAEGDEPNKHERAAAASLAVVGLALLRTDVAKLSRRDEQTLRYEATGRAVADLLTQASAAKVELLHAELLAAEPPRRVAAAATADAAERAAADVLDRPQGAARAARLLEEDHGIAATVRNGAIIDLREPLAGVAEPRLLLALALAEDDGPLYVRGHTSKGRPVVAAWCRPWLAIERTGPSGNWGRAWKLAPGQTPSMLQWDDLPKAACDWPAGRDRPDQVADLLELLDAEGVAAPA